MKMNRLYGKALTTAAHSARSAYRATEADCMKIKRLYGKDIAVCSTFSSFRPP